MPADVEAIVKSIEQHDPHHQHVKNPWAVAWAIHNRRLRARATRAAHRREKREEGNNA